MVMGSWFNLFLSGAAVMFLLYFMAGGLIALNTQTIVIIALVFGIMMLRGR